MGRDDEALRLVFTPAALESLTGQPRAGQLRYKPGTGLSAALLGADASPQGWLRIIHDGGADKLANARRRAARRGLTVDSAQVGGTAFWGPLLTDPGLARAFSALESPAVGWQVLRYNPLKRLVVRADVNGNRVAGRLTRDAHGHLRAAHARLGREVPVVPEVSAGVPGSSRVSWWQWCDGGDLAALAAHSPREARRAAREAGAIAARLHRLAPGPGSDVRSLSDAQLRANERLLSAVDPGLGTRFHAALMRLAPLLQGGGPAVTCHGDLSADQFLLADGAVLLGDLDRVTAGPAALDVGSFAASSPVLLKDFVAGYTDGGPPPPPGQLAAWTAYAHALRVLEPFRAASPGWREQVAQRIHTVEETLCNLS